MTALSGDAPERNPATTPQPVICRIALPSASVAPVSRDQTRRPGKCQEGVGRAAAAREPDGRSRRAITGMTRAWNLEPDGARARRPASDHTCATLRSTSSATRTLSRSPSALSSSVSPAVRENAMSTRRSAACRRDDALLVLEPSHGLVEGQAQRGERSSRSSCDWSHRTRRGRAPRGPADGNHAKRMTTRHPAVVESQGPSPAQKEQ